MPAHVVGFCKDGAPKDSPLIYLTRKGNEADVRDELRSRLDVRLHAEFGASAVETSRDLVKRLRFERVDEFVALGRVRPVRTPTTAGLRSADDQGDRSPALIGDSISLRDGSRGTLGCRVRDRKNPSEIFLLTNWHTITPSCGGCETMTPICHRGGSSSLSSCDSIGTYTRGIEVQPNVANIVDAAIASTTREQVLARGPSPEQVTPTTKLQVATKGLPVAKQGGKTHYTNGSVRCASASMCVRHDEVHLFEKQIVIGSRTETKGKKVKTFCDLGDSGSLVVTEDGHHPVGLIFAMGEMSTTGKKTFEAVCVANPIDEVLAQLDVEIDPPTDDELAERCD